MVVWETASFCLSRPGNWCAMYSSHLMRSHVRELLRQLSRDRLADRTPIAGMGIVQASLNRFGYAPTDQSRQVEACRLVTEVVELELLRLRREIGEVGQGTDVGFRARINRDFSHGHRELEAWSALYHVYLRPDLDLGLSGLADLVGTLHRRTVQRRLRRGIDALTARLLEMEHCAEMSASHERLAAQLPGSSARMIGREATTNHVFSLLSTVGAPSIIALAGPGGIGKTEMAIHLAHVALESGVVEEALWLTMPTCDVGAAASRNDILVELGDRIGLIDNVEAYAVRAALGRRLTLIVVDGLDDDLSAVAAASALVDIVGRGKVLLSGRAAWSSAMHVRRVSVQPLDRCSASTLLRQEAAVLGLEDLANARELTLRPLLIATEGNPRAIRLAASLLQTLDIVHVTTDFVEARGAALELYVDMWRAAWGRAEPEAKAVLRSAIHLGNDGVAANAPEIREACGISDSRLGQVLRDAVASGLLVAHGDTSLRVYRAAMFLDKYLLACDSASSGGMPVVADARSAA
jgi:hypothetical protein